MTTPQRALELADQIGSLKIAIYTERCGNVPDTIAMEEISACLKSYAEIMQAEPECWMRTKHGVKHYSSARAMKIVGQAPDFDQIPLIIKPAPKEPICAAITNTSAA